jgi:hypothetical protein
MKVGNLYKPSMSTMLPMPMSTEGCLYGCVCRPDPTTNPLSKFRWSTREGWLVVASQAAWDAITSQLGTLKLMIHVERSFYDKGERLQRDMQAERILDR